MTETPQGKGDFEVTHRVRIEVTWRTIFRVLLAVLCAHVAVVLWPLFKLIVLAIILAAAAYPIVGWVGRRSRQRWVGIFCAALALLSVVLGCLLLIGPPFLRQIGTLADNLPTLRDQIIAQLPQGGPIHEALEKSLTPGTVTDSRMVLQKVLLLIETTLGGVVYVVLVLALAIYFIIDGPHASRWLIARVPVSERGKVKEALAEILRFISSYVTGQCLISGLCAVYLFLVLSALGVPMALSLGIFAGICDVLPIVGFFLAVFLAMAMALTVSPTTAALVFVLYGVYHLLENFFLVPLVYGRKLKLSKLAVPLAVATGGVLAGVVGAIVVLPLLAAFPVVERLWLTPKDGSNTAAPSEDKAA